MSLRKGTRIRHPKLPAWGLGEVLEDSNGVNVRAFFVNEGEKTLLLKFVKPEVVPKDEASHPVLDNLKISNDPKAIKYQSLAKSIEYFLSEYPGGFYGDSFIDEERNYKVEAHRLGNELLGQAELADLVGSEQYEEVCKRAFKVANKTNLIFPNEKMALKDGLTNADSQEKFAKLFQNFLYGQGELINRFSDFAKHLENIDAAKWPTVSYFPFILRPDKFMFVKPTITQHAANLSAYELNYKPQLNWLTYKSVLNFSQYLKSELAELKPRDMIDVQSFMWCVAPSSS
jgi:hypothetical protein